MIRELIFRKELCHSELFLGGYNDLMKSAHCIFSCKMQHYETLCKSGWRRLKFEAFKLITLEAAWHHPASKFHHFHTKFHNLTHTKFNYVSLSFVLTILFYKSLSVTIKTAIEIGCFKNQGKGWTILNFKTLNPTSAIQWVQI